MPKLPSHVSPVYSQPSPTTNQIPDLDLDLTNSTSSHDPPPTLLSPAFTPPSTPGTSTPSTHNEPRSIPIDASTHPAPRLLSTLPEINCIVRARIPTTTGAEMFLHLYQNNTDDKEHLAIVFGSDIRSKSLDNPRPNETEMDRMIRGAYVGRLHPGRTSSRFDPQPLYGALHSPASLESPLAEQGESNHSSSSAPLVRIHSECYTGETAWSARCDCGEQLDEAARLMSLPPSSPPSSSSSHNPSDPKPNPTNPGGVIIYLRQEGRGIGLSEKLKAYNLQDLGSDTVEANLLLRHPADARSYGLATAMLLDLGLGGEGGIRLLTNNPDKVRAVEGAGRQVVVRERVAMVPLAWRSGGTRGVRGAEIEGYLRTKVGRMGHLIG